MSDVLLLLRIARRKTSWEEKDPIAIYQAEFEDKNGEPDLSPSVYEVQVSDVVRIATEHCAGSNLRDVPSRQHVDLQKFYSGTPRRVPSNNQWFHFAREAHCELPFNSRDELILMLGQVCERGCVRYPVTRENVKEFLGRQREEKDPEWLRFFSQHEYGRLYERLAE